MVRPLCTLALLLALAGCDLNGNDLRYPGASVFQAQDGGFHFHFLAPPWRYQKKEPKHIVYLVVDSYSQFNRSGGEEVTISHKLWVSYGTQASPRAEMEYLRNRAVTGGKIVETDVASFETLTGEEGWSYVTHKDEGEKGRFYYRDAGFLDASGKVIQFSMTAAYPLDVQDIDDLLCSYSAGPDDGTPTPRRLFDGSQPPAKPDLFLAPDLGIADGGAP